MAEDNDNQRIVPDDEQQNDQVGKLLYDQLKEKKLTLALFVVLLICILVLIAMAAITVHKLDHLEVNVGESGDASVMSSSQSLQAPNETMKNYMSIIHALANIKEAMENYTSILLHTLANKETTENYTSIVHALANIKEAITDTAGVVDNILLELLMFKNSSSLFNSITPVSCKKIKTIQPSSPTGYYHVNSRNIYCNMDTLCGSGGGWTRLAYLDMSDATQSCPSGFRLYQSGGVRACGRPVTNSGSCVSVQFPSNGISYSQICGRVVGYQYGSPDAIGSVHPSNKSNLNAPYVDGVSITRGSPRKHVWTLMAGYSDTISTDSNCPCSQHQLVQSFIGNNYYCESGYHDGAIRRLLTADPLWDSKGCGLRETDCCTAPGLPWFHRNYGTNTTTDYLELRVCGDNGAYYEDSPVLLYEIFVK